MFLLYIYGHIVDICSVANINGQNAVVVSLGHCITMFNIKTFILVLIFCITATSLHL